MKKFLFTLAVLLTSIAAQALAPYQPLVQEGRTWVNYYLGNSGYFLYKYELKGDSIVDGKEYKVCYVSSYNEKYSTTDDVISEHPVALLREDNMKVYVIYETTDPLNYQLDYYYDQEGERVLYDFAKSRNMIESGELQSTQVNIDGKVCEKYNSYSFVSESPLSTIESIGADYGTLLFPEWISATCSDYDLSGLTIVLDSEGQVIYRNTEFVPLAEDVNADLNVDIVDVNKEIDAILAGNYIWWGDINDDDKIDIADLNYIIDFILK